MEKIEHIGIAVHNLEEASAVFSALLGKEPYKQEIVEKDGVLTSFYLIGDTKIELLVPTTESSPIAKFLEKKGAGIHHLAFGVNNICEEMERLESANFLLIDKVPRPGADGKIVAFLHPKSTNSVLIELCQDAE
jgi:methylmalonyl-CoA/ethylmalonyl-CoA epimerase